MKRIIFLCVAFVLASFALQDNNCDERIQILEDKLERLMTRLENMRDDRRDDIMSPMMSPKDHLFFNPSPWGYINAADAPFNATGDGKTDNTRSIQMALDYAASNGGGTVFLPVGTYLVNGNLRIGPYVSLKGSSDTPLRSYGTATTVAGTTLLAIAGSGTSSGTPFVFMTGPDTTIEGLSIFYPNQIAKNPPISFPFCISGTGDNLSVKNVLLVNPYQGIDFATESCPRHLIENVYGQPLLTGVQVDQCYDIGRIRHVHFWPFWTWNTDFGNWMGANAVTFRFMRSDWEIVEDVFSWGYFQVEFKMKFNLKIDTTRECYFPKVPTERSTDNLPTSILITSMWEFTSLPLSHTEFSFPISILPMLVKELDTFPF
eukprot:TRINITY_DN6301_c0_g1_i1.p1 TRINITY_DN6301_c0_g1~~TRINITY_DN6301_c0_g1_i1.p1  ORF type:complete len:374 (+),score=78.33 TRINITY_DN6301_c0_g1_i1:40-1161(+)